MILHNYIINIFRNCGFDLSSISFSASSIIAKIPLHEQGIMLSHNFTRERLDHVFSKPSPQAANIIEMSGLLIIQLGRFLQGHGRWQEKVKFFGKKQQTILSV